MDQPKHDNMADLPTMLILFGSLSLACLVFGVGCVTGWEQGRNEVRKDAIDQGYAEYNATTGEWQWKAK